MLCKVIIKVKKRKKKHHTEITCTDVSMFRQQRWLTQDARYWVESFPKSRYAFYPTWGRGEEPKLPTKDLNRSERLLCDLITEEEAADPSFHCCFIITYYCISEMNRHQPDTDFFFSFFFFKGRSKSKLTHYKTHLFKYHSFHHHENQIQVKQNQETVQN